MTDDPYDYDDAPEDECYHEEYDVDILTGMATCTYCGHRWMLSQEDFEKMHQAQVEWDKQVEQWEAEGLNVNEPSSDKVISDDEIPF